MRRMLLWTALSIVAVGSSVVILNPAGSAAGADSVAGNGGTAILNAKPGAVTATPKPLALAPPPPGSGVGPSTAPSSDAGALLSRGAHVVPLPPSNPLGQPSSGSSEAGSPSGGAPPASGDGGAPAGSSAPTSPTSPTSPGSGSSRPNASGNPLGSVGARSGLSWNSGLWPLSRAGSAASFSQALAYGENRRGKKSDINMSGQWYNSWADLTGMQALDFLNDTPSAVSVVMLPPFPSGGTWTAAASGAYDSYYRQIGAKIVLVRPNAKTVLRFAWEMNGDWYEWSIKNTGGATNFINGWRRAVDNMRAGAGAKASNIVFDYSLAALDDKGQGDPLTATYPGDNWVDVIGMDIYDQWGVTTSPTVPGHASEMQRGYDFVVAHGKSLAFDEWGLHHTDAGSPEGKDNPNFISAMYTWFKSHKARLAWEQYFQDDAQNNVNSSLFSPDRDSNPNSRATYLGLWK